MKLINWLIAVVTTLPGMALAQPKIPNQIERLVVIKPGFEGADNFGEGRAPVFSNGKWGYIDPSGKEAIAFKFDFVSSFSEGLAPVQSGSNYRYIDTKGNFISKVEYGRAGAFSETLAAFMKPGEKKYGYLDTKENVKIAPAFDRAKSFSQGLAPVKKDNKWGFIEKDGSFRINAIFEDAGVFSEGLAAVKLSGKWGFIDNTAKVVIPAAYEHVSQFREGLCGVSQNGLYGFVDAKGKQQISLQFEEAYPFSEGLAPAKKAGKWGYIDKAGKWIVEPVLEGAGTFSEGLAYFAISDNGKLLYGFFSNPLKNSPLPAKEEPKKYSETKPHPPASGAPAPVANGEIGYVVCSETQSGWEGEITRIHKISAGVANIVVRWEIINNPYSITVSSGKGKNTKKLFNASKAKFSGYKRIKVSAREEFITVVVTAKKSDTQWKYVIECE